MRGRGEGRERELGEIYQSGRNKGGAEESER